MAGEPAGLPFGRYCMLVSCTVWNICLGMHKQLNTNSRKPRELEHSCLEFKSKELFHPWEFSITSAPPSLKLASPELSFLDSQVSGQDWSPLQAGYDERLLFPLTAFYFLFQADCVTDVSWIQMVVGRGLAQRTGICLPWSLLPSASFISHHYLYKKIIIK